MKVLECKSAKIGVNVWLKIEQNNIAMISHLQRTNTEFICAPENFEFQLHVDAKEETKDLVKL